MPPGEVRMRARVVALAVQSAAVAIALFAIPLAIAVARYFVDAEHTELLRAAETAAVAVSGDLTARPAPAFAVDPDLRIVVYDAGGARVRGVGPARPPSIVHAALGGRVAAATLDGRYGVAVPVSDGDSVAGALVATADRAETYQHIGLAWAAMAGLAAAALGAAWFLARRLSRRLTTPVETLRTAADRLGDGDFSVHAAGSEIAEIDSLAASLNKTARRLGTLLDRERAFAADLSHQLRTPLTGLRLALETASTDPAARDAAVATALAAADRLDATIGDLVTLARDTGQGGDPVDLARLMAEIRERWHGPLAARGRQLRLLAPPDPARPRMSHACARQITEVLLDNASAHGRGTVTVRLREIADTVALEVSDEGLELTGDYADLFRRRSTRAAGTGIGLALARSLALAEGSRLTVTRRAPPTFTLFMAGDDRGVMAGDDRGR
ncbi:HAMP domain-containing histidine kinase [Frankia sp. AgB1.9]|nr:HAMP domain-containing histidine kinase [Frankia sp. AgW1.1]MBL7552130.1 HAMP domain-containing histidine kinase [Frankia sp. AgB1.9]